MEILFMPDMWGIVCVAGVVFLVLWLFWYFLLGGKEEAMKEDFEIIDKGLRAREEEKLRALMLEKLREEHGERERDSSR